MIWGRKRSYSRNFVTVLWWLASYQRHLSLHMLTQFLMHHRRVLTARHMNWLNHLILCCTGKFFLSRRCGGRGKFSIWYWHYRERKNKRPSWSCLSSRSTQTHCVVRQTLAGSFEKENQKTLQPRIPVRFLLTSKLIHHFFLPDRAT